MFLSLTPLLVLTSIFLLVYVPGVRSEVFELINRERTPETPTADAPAATFRDRAQAGMPLMLPPNTPSPMRPPTSTQPAESLVSLVVEECGLVDYFGNGLRTEGVVGTVTNTSDRPLDIMIRVDFEDENRVIVSQAGDYVSALPPGRTARWGTITGGRPFAECAAHVASAR